MTGKIDRLERGSVDLWRGRSLEDMERAELIGIISDLNDYNMKLREDLLHQSEFYLRTSLPLDDTFLVPPRPIPRRRWRHWLRPSRGGQA